MSMERDLLLVDSHCHLDFPDFANDREAILARAAEAGVGTMLSIGTKLGAFPALRALVAEHAALFCTVGVHPHEAGREEAGTTIATLCALADHPKVVGFGESGLDYYYEYSPKEVQQRLFRLHIAAARLAAKPLVIHTRDADEDMIAILGDEMAKGAFSGVIHCFSSGERLADAALEMGLYLSFSGILTFKAADSIRAVAARAPLERILVETDAPYLAPVPRRGKRNEPSYVAHTARKLAEVRGMTVEETAAATTENFFRLFAGALR